MADNLKTFMVDIDGTICSLELYITKDGRIDNDETRAVPHTDRIEYFNDLYDKGHTINYYTARGSSTGNYHAKYELTKNQLDKWGVKYSSVKVGKPHYDVWIDDKAHNVDEFFNSDLKEKVLTTQEIIY